MTSGRTTIASPRSTDQIAVIGDNEVHGTRTTLPAYAFLCLGFLGIGFRSSTTVSTALTIHRCAVSRSASCTLMNALMATSTRAHAVLRSALSDCRCSVSRFIRSLWLVKLGPAEMGQRSRAQFEQDRTTATFMELRKDKEGWAAHESGTL